MKMDAKSKEPETLEVSGDLTVVTVEIAEMISRLYNLLLERDETAAAQLRVVLTALAVDKGSPMWEKKELKGEGTTIVLPKREAE